MTMIADPIKCSTTISQSIIEQNNARIAFLEAKGVMRLLMYIINYIRYGTPIPDRNLTNQETESLKHTHLVVSEFLKTRANNKTFCDSFQIRAYQSDGKDMIEISILDNKTIYPDSAYCGKYTLKEMQELLELTSNSIVQRRLGMSCKPQETVPEANNHNDDSVNFPNDEVQKLNEQQETVPEANNNHTDSVNVFNGESTLQRPEILRLQQETVPEVSNDHTDSVINKPAFTKVNVAGDGYCMFRSILCLYKDKDMKDTDTSWAEQKETAELYDWIIKNEASIKELISETNERFNEMYPYPNVNLYEDQELQLDPDSTPDEVLSRILGESPELDESQITNIYQQILIAQISKLFNPDAVFDNAFSVEGCIIYSPSALYEKINVCNDYSELHEDYKEALGAWVNSFTTIAFKNYNTSVKRQLSDGEINFIEGNTNGYALMVGEDHFNVCVPSSQVGTGIGLVSSKRH